VIPETNPKSAIHFAQPLPTLETNFLPKQKKKIDTSKEEIAKSKFENSQNGSDDTASACGNGQRRSSSTNRPSAYAIST
jgi:hypothetical protein